jgi:hypothetical protein
MWSFKSRLMVTVWITMHNFVEVQDCAVRHIWKFMLLDTACKNFVVISATEYNKGWRRENISTLISIGIFYFVRKYDISLYSNSYFLLLYLNWNRMRTILLSRLAAFWRWDNVQCIFLCLYRLYLNSNFGPFISCLFLSLFSHSVTFYYHEFLLLKYFRKQKNTFLFMIH